MIRPLRTLRPILGTLIVLACAGAGASGGGEAWDAYVNRSGPDIALSRYQAGQLGVILNSYERVYMYQAWRSVMLGADGIKAAANPEGGLFRAIGNRNDGWGNAKDSAGIYKAWKAAVSAALKQPAVAEPPGSATAHGYVNCPLSSYAFATSTLNELAKRADATPARLAAWVGSQQQVFKFCGDDPLAPRNRYSDDKPVIPAPVALPASEPLYWRQMQQYQLASAAFYDQNYALSGSLFAQIGATEKHPLRAWGEYLSLRAQARAATYIPGPNASQARWKLEQAIRSEGPEAAAARLAAQQKKVDAIMASVAHIVANPDLASLHEDSRAIGRAMQARLTPALRFAELSKLLDHPAANPYLEDHLGDWRVLANDLLQQPYGNRPDQRPALRKSAGFIDWMQTVQQCQSSEADNNCAAEQQHALDQWHLYRKEGNQAQARTWLLAAAMMSGTIAPELEQASLQVSAGAPEYLTLRYALARHYRLSQQAGKARALADAVLTGPQLAAISSVSTRNLFLQERFAVATSPADAADYLLRVHSRMLDPDTGELFADQNPEVQPRSDIAADGLRWLNSGLSTADLMALAGHPRLPQEVRTQIAIAAWLRFDLLGQDEASLAAAQQLEKLAPSLTTVTRKYSARTAPAERHYGLLLDALKYGMTPVFNGYYREPQLRAAEETRADMWCKIPAKPGVQDFDNTAAEFSLPMPDLGDTATRDQELSKLGRMKTATGYFGEATMARAKTAPNDPDLPWLLYVTVQSTRGGCLDADSSVLSKNAFSLLHKRYGKTEWSAKTPYFY
jgi:hypothetical protein